MKQTNRDDFRVVITPRRLGDFGWMSMSDRMASSDPERDIRERCEEIAAEVKRHVDNVGSVEVLFTETHTCSHCGYVWEVLTADEAANPANCQDEHSVEGEPVCCDAAIAEFRTQRGIPAVQAEAPAWVGATELASDREITAVAATGIVGYQQNQGRLLHCLAHKPAPASRYADFHEVEADDLDDGGICVYHDCGRDLLAAWPTTAVPEEPAP
ncbi:hypothetical protein [Streptomyces poriferorum]|uniref:Uncharacterized protein n=1 Tax=Streptomyces poriferorum TaxID=2798799 RepID=A0ABY9IYN9_9ACTN|nr:MULTISPECIES: hypothetical protein [unclassified Streptomyces]MDP5310409.1 hypothetical protein [Streptomyces sp. Alt4]WLQ60437.1 hypothetical protein P8A19_35660 [Streptomyces sp. Alt2]